MDKTTTVDRRNFLSALGVTVGGTGLAGAGLVAGPQMVKAATEPPKGKIPSTPLKIGHMTFLTGPAAVLGEPSLKGHILAAEEINAAGRHSRQAQDRDHHGGRERRHRRQRQRNAPHEALREDRHVHRRHLQRQHAGAGTGGRGARPAHDLRRRLHRLPVGQGGAESEVHIPHHQHPVGRRRDLRGRGGADLADGQEDRPHPPRLQLWPQRLRPLHDRLQEAGARRRGRLRRLAEARHDRLHRAHHQDDVVQPRPIVSSVWGGDYVAFYKQALRYGMFNRRQVREHASPSAWRRTPSARIIRKASSPASTPTTTSRSRPETAGPPTRPSCEKYFKRWNEYPNFQSDGAYHTLHMYRTAIEKANRLVGGWPDEEAIISQLEGMYFETLPATSTSVPTTTRATRTR